MLVEGTQLLARVRVPHFAGAIVTSRNEFASIFVEGTVSQGKKMGSEDLEEAEALHLVLKLLLNELLDELLQLGLARFRDQGLLQEDLVNKTIDIGAEKDKENKLVSCGLLRPFLASDGQQRKWREIIDQGSEWRVLPEDRTEALSLASRDGAGRQVSG